ncbi:MFS transporter [uncultured Kiloniella sp.]|uniref:MFS transporter n=1 Tax=uncultured Kiloniella sp. TaxID=1133091 RepID=UPI002611865F|nr:MFS transporter [uncultured Kiloniella sp.]
MFNFILTNARFLAFGFVVAFASSFGQTFYVSLFSEEIRTDLNLSHGDFGAFYSSATLISGFAVIWFGKQIDHMDLRAYSYLVILGLCTATLALAFIPSGLPYLTFPIFFLVRLCGQGLMSHISVTAMARYFHDNRGRAISIASLGLSLGEASLPLLTIWMLSLLDWRDVWILNAGFLGFILMPLVFLLLRGHSERDARMNEQIKSQALASAGRDDHKQWSRRDVLRDKGFYLMLPGLGTLAFIVTGIFFHQIHIVTSKGWSMAWFAGNFTVYAAMITISAVLAGTLVDRFGALRLLIVHIPVFLIGLLFLGLSQDLYAATLFMSFIGISVGFGSTVTSAIWAEVYGTRHIGAIRAMAMSVSVLASALSPALFGWLFDRDVSPEVVVLGCIVWCVFATFCLWCAQRQFLARRKFA